MRQVEVGKTGIQAGVLSYGCMRVSGAWNPKDVTPEMREAGAKAIIAAYEAGYTLFDHADIYGRGTCEEVQALAFQLNPEMRGKITIATKCGIRFLADPNPDSPHRYDFSRKHILWSCEQSLRRLGVETIDIYQLHRPDLLMDPDEVAEAFDELHHSGKVRFFGVSNFLPSFVNALAKSWPELVVNQVEVHLGRLDCFYDGTLDQCIERDMTPLAWSPLGGGWLGDGGTVDPKSPNAAVRTALLEAMDAIAKKLGVSRTVLALAWLLKHPSKIVPIVGTTNPERIRDAAKAADLDFDREDWYRLLVAARGAGLP
ncbi:MAG: aldo/keto reductase [Armatimonadetes bacterium]|nr:aldo/keto reductase [Armatimonadota bacterium]